MSAHYAPAAYVSNFHNPHLFAGGPGKDLHVFYAPDGSITNRLGFVNSTIEGDLLPNSPPPKRPYSGVSPPPEYSVGSSASNHQITDEPSEYADPDSPMLLSSNSDIPLIPPPPATHKRRGSFKLPSFASFRCTGAAGGSSDQSMKELPSRPSQSPSGDSLHYASSDVTTPLKEATDYDWETTTAPSTSSAMIGESLNEIPRHRLQFREKLGEGEFGEVCDFDLVSIEWSDHG